MLTHFTMPTFSLLIIIATLMFQTNYCFCEVPGKNIDDNGEFFTAAIATWYRGPVGNGKTGGECGFGPDVATAPYDGLISAGNQNLFKFGQGCGNCYEVKCTKNLACSGQPITVTITNECLSCDRDAIHFDLSGQAFGSLAKPGQADTLRKSKKLDIEFQRARCIYNANITFTIDKRADADNLAFVVEYVNGDDDIGSIEVSDLSYRYKWISMQRLWGATWKILLPTWALQGPYSVRLNTTVSKTSVVAQDVIPGAYNRGQRYTSNVNFQFSRI